MFHLLIISTGDLFNNLFKNIFTLYNYMCNNIKFLVLAKENSRRKRIIEILKKIKNFKFNKDSTK